MSHALADPEAAAEHILRHAALYGVAEAAALPRRALPTAIGVPSAGPGTPSPAGAPATRPGAQRGRTGRLITIAVPNAQERAALVAEFNAARDAEYAEVLERTPAMLAEIAAETARGRASYAEVEESEADLDRFRAWLAKIMARDYFNAPGRAAAESAIAQCAHALAQFEAAALSADTGTAHATAPSMTDGAEFPVKGS